MRFIGSVEEFERLASRMQSRTAFVDAVIVFFDKVVEICERDISEEEKDKLVGEFAREHFEEELIDHADLLSEEDDEEDEEDDADDDIGIGDRCPVCNKGHMGLLKSVPPKLQCSNRNCKNEIVYESEMPR